MIGLKNATDEDAGIWAAYRQLQTFKAEIPSLVLYNTALGVSGGRYARIGSLSANHSAICDVVREDRRTPFPADRTIAG